MRSSQFISRRGGHQSKSGGLDVFGELWSALETGDLDAGALVHSRVQQFGGVLRERDRYALRFLPTKALSFSVGTLDSYLNDPPASLPPTKRNSFQFTMGLTYAIKSKY